MLFWPHATCCQWTDRCGHYQNVDGDDPKKKIVLFRDFGIEHSAAARLLFYIFLRPLSSLNKSLVCHCIARQLASLLYYYLFIYQDTPHLFCGKQDFLRRSFAGAKQNLMDAENANQNFSESSMISSYHLTMSIVCTCLLSIAKNQLNKTQLLCIEKYKMDEDFIRIKFKRLDLFTPLALSSYSMICNQTANFGNCKKTKSVQKTGN